MTIAGREKLFLVLSELEDEPFMKLKSMMPIGARALGFALVLAATATPAFAISPAPEIDPGLIPSAMVLLVGGVLALKARRRTG